MSPEVMAHYLRLKSVRCIDCIEAGRDGIWPIECMDFDHRDGAIKIAKVSSLTRDLAQFLTEAAKCDVICACCHRIRTKKRGTSNRTRRKLSVAGSVAMSRPEVKAKQIAARATPTYKLRSSRGQQRVSDQKSRSMKSFHAFRRIRQLARFDRKLWMQLTLRQDDPETL